MHKLQQYFHNGIPGDLLKIVNTKNDKACNDGNDNNDGRRAIPVHKGKPG